MRRVLSFVCLALALLVVLVGLVSPPDRRIHVRWAESVTRADRIAAEQTLGLNAGRLQEGQTWSYELPDASTRGITAVVEHPLANDTHHIDRDRRTLWPEVPAARAVLRRVYQSQPVRFGVRWGMVLASVFGVIAMALAWPAVQQTVTSHPSRLILPGILVASMALRACLVIGGGQFYWPDEILYKRSRDVVAAIAAETPGAATSLLDAEHYPLFKAIGLIPATIEFVWGEDARIPAVFFSLFSVLNIWLVVLIARRFGAERGEALLAGALLAASSSFFYYARHLFPYDLAMTFGLLSLYAGIARRDGWRPSLACGAWAACAFLAYSGYWTLGGAACGIHVLDASSVRRAIRRAGLTVLGLAMPIGAFILGNATAEGRAIYRFVALAKSITQGEYEEGWSLPIEYLWHAEHLFLVVWLAALAWCIWKWRHWATVRGARAGAIGVVFVYGALVICSVGFHLFVVYGRLARQAVPFLCLVTAAVLAGAQARRPALANKVLAGIAAALVIQVALNFREPLTQRFPDEFTQKARELSSGAGSQKVVALNAYHMYPPAKLEPPASHRTLDSARHPLQFRPYQYEGYTPRERVFLRSTDIRMRLLIPE